MQTPAIFRALELFSKGKYAIEILDIIDEEYEMEWEEIKELVSDAHIQFNEGQIPLENIEL